MPDMSREDLDAIERAICKAIREHEESRHLAAEVEEFLRDNQKAIEWLVDTVRGPQMIDPISGKAERDIEQGLDARVKRIEEQTSAIPALTEAVARMESRMNNGGVRAFISFKDLSKVTIAVGTIIAGLFEGFRIIVGS